MIKISTANKAMTKFWFQAVIPNFCKKTEKSDDAPHKYADNREYESNLNDMLPTCRAIFPLKYSPTSCSENLLSE